MPRKKQSKPSKKKPVKKARIKSKAKPKAKAKAAKPRKAAKKPVRQSGAPTKAKATASPQKQKRTPIAPLAHVVPANHRELGHVEDYFAHVEVIALFLKEPLAVGDVIHVRGHTTDLTQAVESMQIDHKPIQAAKKGAEVGIKVNDKCRKGDLVYKVL